MSSTVRTPMQQENERGIALVAALLIVMLISVVAAAFVLVTSGERSVSSNVQVSRGALLAADAGVRVAQQVLANQAKSKLDNYTLNWTGPPSAIITSPTTMFTSSPITVTGTNPQFSATASITFTDSTLAPTAQTYNFHYTITSTGGFGAQGQRQVQSSGILRVSAERGTFADYLAWSQIHRTPPTDPNPNQPVWFTSSSQFDGRVHTNDELSFAFNPLFQDQTSSVNAKSWFFNNGSPLEKSGNSNGLMDVPLFYGGFKQGATAIALPVGSGDQQAAALGYTPAGFTPTNTQINAALGLGGGSTAPPNGIYLPNSGGAKTGGIYVQGALDHLTMSADTVAHTQVYVLTQGGTTKTITIDRNANTTTVQSGAASTVLAGVPVGAIFVNGMVADLRGPDRVAGLAPPAIAAGNQVLLTAAGDIVIQRDLICENYTGATNVLGIYSSGGAVRIDASAPDDMNLDAFVMATGAAGAFEVDGYDSGAARGAFHLRGGVVQRYFGAFYTFDASGNVIHGFARDWHYDRRGLIPPFYPSTNRFTADQPTARTLAWKEL